MNCPKCFHAKTKVYNSRYAKERNQTWRRRQCLNCKLLFTTREYVELEGIIKVRRNNDATEPFSRTKLLLSLAKALSHHTTAESASSVAATVEKRLLEHADDDSIPVETIMLTCLQVLRRFDTKAYLRYLAEYPGIQDRRDLRRLMKQ